MSIIRKVKTAFLIYLNHGLKNFIKLLISKIINYESNPSIVDDMDPFYIHSKAISQRYPKADSFSMGRISDSLIFELQELIKTIGDDSIKNSITPLKEYNNLIIGGCSKTEEFERLEEQLIVHPLHLLDTLEGPIERLHKELRKIFVDNIKSPFAFINTRAWTTRPSSAQYGPNALHKDGFKLGHMKIMIYLTPLNEEYGDFTLENKKITNHPQGTCICFANSDVLHAGVPGKKYNRVCIEVTIMRSFIDSPQFYKGVFFGRHFTSPEVVYQISNKLVKKFANKDNIEQFNKNDIIH